MGVSERKNNERPEPYRLLFPVGIGLGLIGVLPWLSLRLGLGFFTDPIGFHGRLMFWGFLAAFVAGFLMTAAPKMSGTWAARPWEVAVIGCLLLAHLVVLALFGIGVGAGVAVLLPAFLLFFLGRRLRHRGQTPPAMFIFVPVGLISGALGLLMLAGAGALSPEMARFARHLAYDSFILNLIVGLGSRLVPVLSRVQGALSPHEAGRTRWIHQLPVLLALNVSFPLEDFVSRPAGQALRAAVLGVVLIRGFRVFAPRARPGFLSLGLRAAAVMLVVPHFFLPFFPAWELHLLHIVYIGGFSLMTLMIAVRVVLAHGGEALEFELHTRALGMIVGTFLIAALVRGLWPLLSPGRIFDVAAGVSFLWMFALGVWWLKVGRKIQDRLGVFRE